MAQRTIEGPVLISSIFSEADNLQVTLVTKPAAITFCKAHGYLPSFTVSLLGKQRHVCVHDLPSIAV